MSDKSDILTLFRDVRNELVRHHRESVKLSSGHFKGTEIQSYFCNADTPKEENLDKEEKSAPHNIIWRRAGSLRKMQGFVDEDFILHSSIHPLTTKHGEFIKKTPIIEEPWLNSEGQEFFDANEELLNNSTPSSSNCAASWETNYEYLPKTCTASNPPRPTSSYHECSHNVTEPSKTDSDHNFAETITSIPESPSTITITHLRVAELTSKGDQSFQGDEEHSISVAEDLIREAPAYLISMDQTQSNSITPTDVCKIHSPQRGSSDLLNTTREAMLFVPNNDGIALETRPSNDSIGVAQIERTHYLLWEETTNLNDNPSPTNADSPQIGHDYPPESEYSWKETLNADNQALNTEQIIKENCLDLIHRSTERPYTTEITSLDHEISNIPNTKIMCPLSESKDMRVIDRVVDTGPGVDDKARNTQQCITDNNKLSYEVGERDGGDVVYETVQQGFVTENGRSRESGVVLATPVLRKVQKDEAHSSSQNLETVTPNQSSVSTSADQIERASGGVLQAVASLDRLESQRLHDEKTTSDSILSENNHEEPTLKIDFSEDRRATHVSETRCMPPSKLSDCVVFCQESAAKPLPDKPGGTATDDEPNESIQKRRIELVTSDNSVAAASTKTADANTRDQFKNVGGLNACSSELDHALYSKDSHDPELHQVSQVIVNQPNAVNNVHPTQPIDCGGELSVRDRSVSSKELPEEDSLPENSPENKKTIHSKSFDLNEVVDQEDGNGLIGAACSSERRLSNNVSDFNFPVSPPRPIRESDIAFGTKLDTYAGTWLESRMKDIVEKTTLADVNCANGEDAKAFYKSGEPVWMAPAPIEEVDPPGPKASMRVGTSSLAIPIGELLSPQELCVDNSITSAPAPMFPRDSYDRNTHHLIAGYLTVRSSPKHRNIYAGTHQTKLASSPDSSHTPRPSARAFKAPFLRTSERATRRKDRSEPSTPHRVESSKSPFSPSPHRSIGSTETFKGPSATRLQYFRSPLQQSFSTPTAIPAVPKTSPQLGILRSKASHGIRSVDRSKPNRKERQNSLMCMNKFVFNRHPTMGPCGRCWNLATVEEQAKFKSRGTHLRIVRTRGGCDRNCSLFPANNDDPAVRLCRKCFFDTHQREGDRLQVYRGKGVKVLPKS